MAERAKKAIKDERGSGQGRRNSRKRSTAKNTMGRHQFRVDGTLKRGNQHYSSTGKTMRDWEVNDDGIPLTGSLGPYLPIVV